MASSKRTSTKRPNQRAAKAKVIAPLAVTARGTKAAVKKLAKKASPVKASPVKASAVKASPVKASPAKASPVKASAAKASAVRQPRTSRTIHTPALDRALEVAEVAGYMARLPPPLKPMVKRLRSILLESAPEALEFLEHETPSYFARGVFARIEPKEREVLVRFLRGGSLPSSGELKGHGEERTLKLTSLEELKTEVLKKLVREAVAFNLTLAGQSRAEA